MSHPVQWKWLCSDYGTERLAKRPKPRHSISNIFLEMTEEILSEPMTVEGSIMLFNILFVLTSGYPFISISVPTLISSLWIFRCIWALFKQSWSLKENSGISKNRNSLVWQTIPRKRCCRTICFNHSRVHNLPALLRSDRSTSPREVILMSIKPVCTTTNLNKSILGRDEGVLLKPAKHIVENGCLWKNSLFAVFSI